MTRKRNTTLTSTNKNVIGLIQKARLNKGYSQRHLSRLLDMNPAYVFLIEADRGTIPLIKVVEYCELLDIDLLRYEKAYLSDRKLDFRRDVGVYGR